MPQKEDQTQFDFGFASSSPAAVQKCDLTIQGSPAKKLTPAQAEFNKRMKALDKARATLEKERKHLDALLRDCTKHLLPLLEKANRVEFDVLLAAVEKRRTMKLTPRRLQWLGDLLSHKVSDILYDPLGLSAEDIEVLDKLLSELGPSIIEERQKEQNQEEFDELRQCMEQMAKEAGFDLDLDGIDINGDPAEIEQKIHERFGDVQAGMQKKAEQGVLPSAGKRKPSKAALKREQEQRELEEAKQRDFKTLYKQLAKVLHPDLETDPQLKLQREVWMKRLTAARDNGDLREMLEIEMAWLGQEAGNLSTASDEKLKIYAMVLKEQVNDIKVQTEMLLHEPQYHLLRRFLPPFGRYLNVRATQADMMDDIFRFENMLYYLQAGGKDAQDMLHSWADSHAREWER